MRVPISWLKDYVDLVEPVEALAERLSLSGLEVEAVHRIGDWWDPETLVVGRVTAVRSHPSADRLALVEVEHGPGRSEVVVTGAPDMLRHRGAESLPVLKVAFARAGAVLVDAYAEERPRPKKVLQPAEIRGVLSAGMVCSERELGLSDEHEGILLLAEDAPTGRPLREVLGTEVLEIAFTPDMARAMSVVGVAREIASLTGAELRLPEAGVPAVPAETTELEVEIADPALSNRYLGAVLHDVTVAPSPAWMRERLRLAGLTSISNVVDVTNYVMLEYGQPLHAFDADLLAARAERSGRHSPLVVVRRAEPGETITTLDGVERTLDGSVLLIADSAGPIGIAGVMGGLETAIHAGTRSVVLESATFHGIGVRRAAQLLRLHTDASARFARGVPATLNEVAAHRAIDLLQRHAGARATAVVDRYPVRQKPGMAYLTASEVRRQLGVPVELPAIVSSLERLDFEVETLDAGVRLENEGEAALGLRVEPGETVLRCTAPWYRLDVELPADLTEEVARVLGYASIPTTRMADSLPPPFESPILETEERLRDLLVGCGLEEHINYTVTSVESHEKLGQSPGDSGLFVTLANPLSANRRVMRRSMLVSAVEALAGNLRYTDRERSFEIGRVYLPEQGDGVRPREERRLAVLLTGPRRPAGVHPDPGAGEPLDFFDLKGVLEALLDALGWLSDVELVPRPGEPPFGPRCAELRGPAGRIGIAGELHPLAAAGFDLEGRRVCLAELLVEPLVRPAWRTEAMPSISNYPPVVEDLAFVVAEEVTAHRLGAVIRRAGAPLLTALEVFDLYRGEPLPPGTKSLAFKLTYQSHESTLGSTEVAAARRRIEAAVAEAVGGRLRA